MNAIPKFHCDVCHNSYLSQEDLQYHKINMHKGKTRRSVDPLVQSVKRVRREWRKTPAGKLQSLLDEERKWKRRATIANNKLADVRAAINGFAAELVVPEEESK